MSKHDRQGGKRSAKAGHEGGSQTDHPPKGADTGLRPVRVVERGSFAAAICDCGWQGPGRRARKKARVDVLIGCNRVESSEIAICGGTHIGFLAATGRRERRSDSRQIALERLQYRQASVIIAHSDMMRDELRSLYGVAGQTTRDYFQGDDKIAEYRISSGGGGADLGATLGTLGTLRVGPRWTQVHAKVDTGDPILPSVTELTAGGRAALTLDALDHAWFPQSGYTATITYYGATKALGSAVNYQRFEAKGLFAHSWGRHTLSFSPQGGTDFGTNMPAYESFALGGPLRLSGFRLNQFSGRQYWFGRAMYYWRIFYLPELVGSGVYAGASAEAGRIRDRVDGLPSPGTQYSGSLFLGAATVAGPLYLGVGVGSGGAVSGYLLLGAP